MKTSQNVNHFFKGNSHFSRISRNLTIYNCQYVDDRSKEKYTRHPPDGQIIWIISIFLYCWYITEMFLCKIKFNSSIYIPLRKFYSTTCHQQFYFHTSCGLIKEYFIHTNTSRQIITNWFLVWAVSVFCLFLDWYTIERSMQRFY